MEYEKMTKQELIDKLNEQQHLADAINAKDTELADLRNENKRLTLIESQYRTLVRTNASNEKIAAEAHSAMSVAESNLSITVDNLKKDNAKALESQAKMYEAQLKNQNDLLTRRTNELNRFVGNFGSFLKIMQGSTDMAIELNAAMIADIQRE